MKWGNLSNRGRKNKSDTTGTDGAGDALWQRIREPENFVPLHHPYGRQAAELGKISDSVRETLADEEEHLEHAAQASFTPVHERLMDAIAASRDSSVRKPGKFGLPAIFRTEARGRTLLVHCALAFIVVFAAASGGHYVGYHRNTTALPVQSIIDDYHAGLRNPLPYEFVADDPATAAAWLSRQLGMKVHLPTPKRAGIKLLGARHHRLHGHPVAQTHYLKNGTHVALYQIHAPRYGLGDLDEVEIKGHLYYIKNSGLCNMVIWRVDDNVMAMVSPFAMRESLLLAQAMRTNSRALPEYA